MVEEMGGQSATTYQSDPAANFLAFQDFQRWSVLQVISWVTLPHQALGDFPAISPTCDKDVYGHYNVGMRKDIKEQKHDNQPIT